MFSREAMSTKVSNQVTYTHFFSSWKTFTLNLWRFLQPHQAPWKLLIRSFFFSVHYELNLLFWPQCTFSFNNHYSQQVYRLKWFFFHPSPALNDVLLHFIIRVKISLPPSFIICTDWINFKLGCRLFWARVVSNWVFAEHSLQMGLLQLGVNRVQ